MSGRMCVYNAYRRVVLRRIDATVLLGLEILGCECGGIERRSSKKPCSWDAWWPAKLVFAAWSWWIEQREAVDGPTAPKAVPGHRGSKVQAIYLCRTINRFQIPTARPRMQQSLHPQAPMSHPNDLCASDTAKTLFKLFFRDTTPMDPHYRDHKPPQGCFGLASMASDPGTHNSKLSAKPLRLTRRQLPAAPL